MFLKIKNFEVVHMKKIFALVLATVFSSSLFAAFQYEIVPTPYTNEHYEGTAGNYFVVNVTGGTGNFYITDKINNLYSMSGNNEVLANVMSNYGYIDLATNEYFSGTWETTRTYEKQMNKWNDLVYQTAYKLGTFSAGDSFGVWIENLSGERNTSVYTEYSKHGSYGLDGTDQIGTVLAELDYNIANPSAIFFGFYAEGISTPTFGQPLPGMLATFLLGGSVLGAAGLKRRKNRS